MTAFIARHPGCPDLDSKNQFKKPLHMMCL